MFFKGINLLETFLIYNKSFMFSSCYCIRKGRKYTSPELIHDHSSKTEMKIAHEKIQGKANLTTS